MQKAIIEACATKAADRFGLWERILNVLQATVVMEVGIWKAEFASHMLAKCGCVQTYYMIDPWKKLPGWNKPFNVENHEFDEVYREAMQAVVFARNKLRVLRGTTLEVVDQVDDDSLDFAYIDGHHTLRGITIDLISIWKKVRPGGYLGGDDLSPSIWQHGESFEPTLVFPFALYFAEAMQARIYALPYQQFLIEKPTPAGSVYQFDDLGGIYAKPTLREQMLKRGAPL